MDERRKIDCISAADRDALVMIFSRNGYTVRQVKEKQSNKLKGSNVKAVKVDGEKIKPDVFYTLINGNVMEAKDND